MECDMVMITSFDGFQRGSNNITGGEKFVDCDEYRVFQLQKVQKIICMTKEVSKTGSVPQNAHSLKAIWLSYDILW